MENQINKVTIDFGNNPELAEVFVEKKPGNKCKLTVEFSIDEINNSQVVGSITSVTGYKGKSDEIKPSYKSPVMIMVSSKKDETRDDAYSATPGL